MSKTMILSNYVSNNKTMVLSKDLKSWLYLMGVSRPIFTIIINFFLVLDKYV